MLKRYHRLITERALAGCVDRRALEAIIAANLHQDHLLTGQIGHPEFHFDDNAFAASAAYLEAQRERARQALRQNRPLAAWKAFGRLIHTAQDLYAHSNYVRLWLERHPAEARPPVETIDPCDEAVLTSPALHSGKVYYVLELASLLPPLRDWALAHLPPDSHAWMNLDSPDRGPLFDYALEAAIKRTRLEYERTLNDLPAAQAALFAGHPPSAD
ncbi:MAG: hypothetical protein ABWK53_03435 [Anaerolineales bacterium]